MNGLPKAWISVLVVVSTNLAISAYAKTPIPDFTRGDTIDLTKPETPVDWNLGSTGARGWVYGWFGSTKEARQILITKVNRGSPADSVLQEGDVILGIDGAPFASDAREAFGKALTVAETAEAEGRLKLLRWRAGKTETVPVQLEVMGSYSKTTPWDCPKSEKILKRACDYLIREGAAQDDMGIPAKIRSLALMATGEESYMPIVAEHIDSIVRKAAASGDNPPEQGLVSWSWGYSNLLLCEYYLRTHEEKVLPVIRKYSTALALGQACSGTWGHGMAPPDQVSGKPHGALGGYGSMNQISTICWMSLVLAKRCGVTDPEIEQAITKGYDFLSYFVDMGTVSYGDNLTGGSEHDDNGKTSAAAVAFALFGDRAGADFFSRMTVASHQERESGHTGNYFSLLWGALGAARAGEEACGAFLREHCWVYDLERRWDGGFEYQGQGGNGNGYDAKTGRQRNNAGHQYSHWDTTGSRVLMYCLPRAKLVITGRDLQPSRLNAAEVADAVAAPRRKHGSQYTFDEILKRLGSWSPVVRNWAGQDFASRVRDNVDQNIPILAGMLRGPDRYARYGACSALSALGPKAQPALDDMIACLESEDRVLQLNAIMALGACDDKRALTALLKAATRELPDYRYDIVRRYIGKALFEDNGGLFKRVGSDDRQLLIAASRRFLRSPTGHCRTLVGTSVAPSLTLDEYKTLYSDFEFAFYQTATTYNTAIQMAVIKFMADHRVREGINRCVQYLTEMKAHGSQDRVPEVLGILMQYGVHARSALPKLKEAVEYFETKEVDFPKELSRGKAKAVRETIALLEAMGPGEESKIELISIGEAQ